MVGITTQSTFYVPSAQVLMPYRHFPFNIQHELNTILPVLVTTSDTFPPSKEGGGIPLHEVWIEYRISLILTLNYNTVTNSASSSNRRFKPPAQHVTGISSPPWP